MKQLIQLIFLIFVVPLLQLWAVFASNFVFSVGLSVTYLGLVAMNVMVFLTLFIVFIVAFIVAYSLFREEFEQLRKALKIY